jgi:hypothetical protein
MGGVVDPMLFLVLAIALTASAAGAHVAIRRLRSGKLRGLAAEWGMHYSPGDRFHLANRVAPRIPCSGAADVRVVDLIYGLKGERFRYVFTAEYTEGVVGTKHRRRRVVAMTEPKDRGVREEVIGDLGVAPEDLPLIEQYRNLGAIVKAS